MPKTYASTYLYNKYSEYEKQIFNFIMTAEQISKVGDGFADIKYEVKKRQISNSLIRVMESANVILLIGQKPLPKSFKVFAAKDVKGDKKVKAFIDCTGLIGKSEGGNYVCGNVDMLVAYLVSAMTTLIYQLDEKRLVGNGDIAEYGARCFSSLFTHIVDYVCKISITSNIKEKCLYMTSAYFLTNVLGREYDNEGTKAIARRISGLSEREEEIIKIQLNENSFTNIKFFVESICDVLKLSNLSLDIVIEKWMYLYGIGTVFALELFPSFSAMITDAYVGCYMNNQKTIEKIAGRSMVDYTKTVLRIGDGVV